MDDLFFPKPPPEKHAPLEKWLRRTDRAESGREPFFRGRNEEYGVFRSAAMSLNDGVVGGGTMVFQGAPGSGKSALMAECMEAVRIHSTPEDPWLAVSLRPGFLDSPLDLIESLISAARMEGERLRSMAAGTPAREKLDELWELAKSLGHELKDRGGGILGLQVGGKREETVTIGRVFRGAAPLLGEFRIVVFVDEAQTVPVTETTRVALDFLHRDPEGIPLVAAFFGLSDTKQVLRQCGLSRFPDGRVVDLETLPLEDAACAIRSVFDAYDFTGNSEAREAWVDSLSNLSQGWPQHINRISVAAAQVIREHGNRIMMEHLEEALECGRERKDSYNRERIDTGSSWGWVYRRLALAAQEKDGVLSWDDIDILTESARARRDETTDQFLSNALHAGLLAPALKFRDRYEIPIPSLGDFLRGLSEEPPAWA